MLSPPLSDQDFLGAMVTRYEPRMQACLISTNVKSTQEARAVLTKLQFLENSKEKYRTTRRDFENQDQNRWMPRDQPSDGARNCRPNGGAEVRHDRRDNTDRIPKGESVEGSTIDSN